MSADSKGFQPPTITALMFNPGPIEDSLVATSLELPDPQGASQFLTADPSRPVQLRPVLQSETPHRKVLPSHYVLVCREPPGLGIPLQALVSMPPFQRENTPPERRDRGPSGRALQSGLRFTVPKGH